jgi:hypothetical protein
MLTTSNLIPPAVITTDPRANGRKITEILVAGTGSADLYRKIAAGPSDQRADLHVGRVRYREYGPDEFAILDPRSGDRIGLARREIYAGAYWWSITAECPYSGGLTWMGYAETLSAGVDWCVNGLHAARAGIGRRDSYRISPATIRTSAEVRAEANRKHTAECAPCRDAGQRNGFIDCVNR